MLLVRSVLVLGALIVAAACAPAAGETAAPGAAASATTATSSSDECHLISSSAVSRAAGSDARFVASESTGAACSFAVAASPDPYDVVVRSEDAFRTLDEVGGAFQGGTEPVSAHGQPALWIPSVGTLWVTGNGPLMAVQVVNFEGADNSARDIALAVAAALAGAP